MLSSGTRIGSARILNWLSEGSCGQSYHCVGSEGEIKGKEFYIKLIPRELSERKGFQDYFLQEGQALEQLDGPGVWPVESFGVTKWKHWIRYPWLEGKECKAKVDAVDGQDEQALEEKHYLRTLEDLCKFEPEELSSGHLLSIMISVHRGLYRAHVSGVCHGNLKPTNILVQKNNNGEWEGFISEFGLYRLNLFTPYGLSEDEQKEVSVMNLDGRASFLEGEKFRPEGVDCRQMPEETWDLCAVGKIARWVIDQVRPYSSSDHSWDEWQEWASMAGGADGREPFHSCAHSMNALPDVGDISRFGVKIEDLEEDSDVNLEELRLERELAFKLKEQTDSLKTKRGITVIVGGLSFLFFLIYSSYLLIAPAPWTEYSLEGLLDSYQMGAGVFGGQAWGIVPSMYDEEGDGGQDVVGEWTKEDGLFKLKFKRFKKSREEASGKKLWQFIGEGKTSVEDYFIWSDYLEYDRTKDALLFIKREDSKYTYYPGEGTDGLTRLYPAERINDGLGGIRKADLLFKKAKRGEVRWSLFFALGFLFASCLYHRQLKKLSDTDGEMIE